MAYYGWAEWHAEYTCVECGKVKTKWAFELGLEIFALCSTCALELSDYLRDRVIEEKGELI